MASDEQRVFGCVEASTHGATVVTNVHTHIRASEVLLADNDDACRVTSSTCFVACSVALLFGIPPNVYFCASFDECLAEAARFEVN